MIVDLGVDYGYSSVCFALPGIGTVYGVDSFEGDSQAGFRSTHEFVLDLKRDLALENLEVVKGDFALVAESWTKPIDILHIDGFHDYESVAEDYRIWSRFVRPGGLVLFHDTCVEGYGVRKFFDEQQLPKLNFPCSNGLGVISSDARLIGKIRSQFYYYFPPPTGLRGLLTRAGRWSRRKLSRKH